MPLDAYGVLAGRVVDHRAEGGTDTPHYQIHLRSGGADFRVAVNVLSRQHPSELLYLADEAFSRPGPAGPAGRVHPAAEQARRGGAGLHPRQPVRPAAAPAGAGHRTRARQRPRRQARPLRPRAAADPAARLYAFGQRWGPEPIRDKVFGFAPGNGIHDIHMNQGNSPQFQQDDGVWQDGGLLAHYPAQDQWVAIFLAFQSQAWHTDDLTGHALSTPEPGEPTEPGEQPDLTVRIVAALVNPSGPAPEPETVTLLNASPTDVDLTGWSLLDREKRRMALDAGVLPAGDTVRLPVAPPVQLGNRGGLITLLDPGGLKVDGVAYTKAQADAEGSSLVF
jgi:uncharacterized protein YukJ